MFSADEQVKIATRVKRGSSDEIMCVTLKEPDRLQIHLLTEQNDTYSIAKTYQLEDLRVADFEESSETRFKLTFRDKTIHFETGRSIARSELLYQIIHLCDKVLSKQVETNLNILDLGLRLELEGKVQGIEDKYIMSPEEEKEIQTLLESRNFDEISTLYDVLADEAHSLETLNIDELIHPTHIKDVENILDLLNQNISYTDQIANEFMEYKSILDGVHDSVEQIRAKNDHLQIGTRNLTNIYNELDNLISQIILQDDVVKILSEPEKYNAFQKELPACIEAKTKLDKVLKLNFTDNLGDIKSVREQKITYSTIRDQFLGKFSTFMKSYFVQLKDLYIASLKTKEVKKNIFKSPGHEKKVIESLTPYKPLVHWLLEKIPQASLPPQISVDLSGSLHDPLSPPPDYVPAPPEKDSTVHENAAQQVLIEEARHIQDEYAMAMANTYRVEFKKIFKTVNKITFWKKTKDTVEFEPDQLKGIKGKPQITAKPAGGPGNIGNRSYEESHLSVSMAVDIDEPLTEQTEKEEDETIVELGDGEKKKNKKELTIDVTYQFTLKKVLPMIKTEQDFVFSFFLLKESALDLCLDRMFEILVPYFKHIISSEYKMDPFICLKLSVQTDAFIKIYERDSSFILKILNLCHQEISMWFDKFTETQANNILETKITQTKRIGILGHIRKLIKFVDKMESMDAKQAKIAEKAYRDILRACFKFINNCADFAVGASQGKKSLESMPNNQSANPKKPKKAGYIIKLENFHHIFTELEPRKVTCLDSYIEEAKKLYEEALLGLVKEIAQLQFSSLMTFLDGVDDIYKNMKGPVEYETIQYEEKLTNRILSKLVKKYPLSSIEKGMASEYKKLTKNLSVEEGLLNTVWDRLKDFMYNKYKHFEFLVAQCYKNQRLAFTSDELLASIEKAEK
uniref:Exocyst complex component Sec3 PIP2-binding N-terminal domain-containing protein n=1 Tax=Arcella intermedia TaxID=1963864 RepID=A0A6B2KXK4_9EUKA